MFLDKTSAVDLALSFMLSPAMLSLDDDSSAAPTLNACHSLHCLRVFGGFWIWSSAGDTQTLEKDCGCCSCGMTAATLAVS